MTAEVPLLFAIGPFNDSLERIRRLQTEWSVYSIFQ